MLPLTSPMEPFLIAARSCCGVERVYAHKNVYQKVLEILIKEGKKLTLGDPLNSETTLGGEKGNCFFSD